MSWEDRLKNAVVYTSPSGVKTSADYEDVKKTVDKKTTGFEFPDANGTLVQDLGHTGRRYPLRLFFWGDNHDKEATVFETSLLEIGQGKLEHPFYGSIDVVPFGTITRNDRLKTAANQSVIDVVFWETIGAIYPISQTDPSSSVSGSVDEYNNAAAEGFENSTKLSNATEQASLKNKYLGYLNRAKVGLQTVADTQANVQKQFNTINDSITLGIDILIGTPLTLAFQTLIMLQAPGRALSDIKARLNAYRNLANSFITGDNTVVTPGNDASNTNDFHAQDLFVSTTVTGSIISVINNQFTTKIEALETAEAILEQFDEITIWRDDNFQSLSTVDDLTPAEIDTGEAYQQLQEAIALTVGFLIQISFTLKQERIVVLDRPRTCIDLVAEFYGSIDDQLDFFINSNNLSGSEIFELPRGREIVFYI